jgi:hypothetical protein
MASPSPNNSTAVAVAAEPSFGVEVVIEKNREPAKFILTLEPLPGVEPIRSLRALLKQALRSHGLRCVDAREEPTNPNSRSD